MGSNYAKTSIFMFYYMVKERHYIICLTNSNVQNGHSFINIQYIYMYILRLGRYKEYTPNNCCVFLCVSPRSSLSNWSKRVKASPWGHSSRRKNTWNAAGWIETRARIPGPQRVDYHPTMSRRPTQAEGECLLSCI